MVKFAVFNELSLPFTNQEEAEVGFLEFFNLLKELKEEKSIKRVRQDFLIKEMQVTHYDWMPSFFNKVKDRDLKENIRLFLANNLITIEAPLVSKSEEDEALLGPSYHYESNLYFGGLACAEYWNAIALSFKSHTKWNRSTISLTKDGKAVTVLHASDLKHLNHHQDYFEVLERKLRTGITQSNFWQRRNELFTRVAFLDKVEKEVSSLNSIVFSQFVSVLLDIETGARVLSELDITDESNTTKQTPRLSRLRTFTYKGQRIFFGRHIKNLPNSHRIHFIEEDKVMVIGYVGPHLKV